MNVKNESQEKYELPSAQTRAGEDITTVAQQILELFFISKKKIWFIIKDTDPWIHGSAAGSAAGAAARAAAGAAAGAAASAAGVRICYIIVGGVRT